MMLSVMTLLMLQSSYVSANSQVYSNPDYDQCIKSRPCPNDGKSLNDLTEEEQHKTYHCRVKRHMECSIPEENK